MVVGSGACDRVRELYPRHLGHSERRSDEVTLIPELVGDEGDGRNASAGHTDAVTHGAGRTATSMAVGGDDRRTLGFDLIKDRVARDGRSVSLVPAGELDVGA